ncbi:outer membrane protein assembly factor BamB family protein [Desulfotomaculum sp. 1211_IL3151]|uniref:outer membrane protein assembly factor BamB family protein n=1 Tax=Desulfotomaculum sp. 1211_IL3151 TaxID=3084055 RepID=UPI002FD8A2B1
MKRALFLTLMLFLFVNNAEAAGRFYPYGEVKWTVEKAGKLSADVTITDNGLLYTPVGNKIICYDWNRGTKLWERKMDVGGKITEPLLIQNQTIYVTGTDGIQQMRPNGNVTWLYRLLPKAKGTKSSGVVAKGPNDLIFLGLADGLYALEPLKNYQWRYSDDKNMVAALGDDRAVYLCLGDQQGSFTLQAIDQRGEKRWQRSLGGIKDIKMQLGSDDTLYAVTNPEKLERNSVAKVRCYDKVNGEELWSYAVRSESLTDISLAGDDLLFFCGNGKLYCLNNNGTLQWDLPLLNVSSGAAVDAAKKRIYVGSTDGRIFCVGFAGRVLWEKEIDKTTGQTLAKGGGVMIDTGKDEKDTITKAPILLPDGSIFVYTDKGKMYRFVDTFGG